MISRRGALGAFAGLALGGLAPRTAQARDFWGESTPGLPTDFLFGYGTLISEPSRTATSRRRVPAVPARLSTGFGHVRGFVARGHGSVGFTALGLRPPREGEAPSSINGVVFPVMDAEEMAAFDRREGGYDRVELDPSLIEPAGWPGLPRTGRIWAYRPKPRRGLAQGQDVPDADYPLLQSYIDVVMQGALAEGEAFARELIETTFDWSPFWLDDRPIPRRPWALTPDSGAIDALLSTVEPAADQFRNRLYPELYAARYLLAAQPAPPR